jgi:hypothetical protein
MLKTDANIADFNKVESTVFLTAPATLEVAVGGQAYTHVLPAGLSVVTDPLSTGTISALALSAAASMWCQSLILRIL